MVIVLAAIKQPIWTRIRSVKQSLALRSDLKHILCELVGEESTKQNVEKWTKLALNVPEEALEIMEGCSNSKHFNISNMAFGINFTFAKNEGPFHRLTPKKLATDAAKLYWVTLAKELCKPKPSTLKTEDWWKSVATLIINKIVIIYSFKLHIEPLVKFLFETRTADEFIPTSLFKVSEVDLLVDLWRKILVSWCVLPKDIANLFLKEGENEDCFQDFTFLDHNAFTLMLQLPFGQKQAKELLVEREKLAAKQEVYVQDTQDQVPKPKKRNESDSEGSQTIISSQSGSQESVNSAKTVNSEQSQSLLSDSEEPPMNSQKKEKESSASRNDNSPRIELEDELPDSQLQQKQNIEKPTGETEREHRGEKRKSNPENLCDKNKGELNLETNEDDEEEESDKEGTKEKEKKDQKNESEKNEDDEEEEIEIDDDEKEESKENVKTNETSSTSTYDSENELTPKKKIKADGRVRVYKYSFENDGEHDIKFNPAAWLRGQTLEFCIETKKQKEINVTVTVPTVSEMYEKVVTLFKEKAKSQAVGEGSSQS